MGTRSTVLVLHLPPVFLEEYLLIRTTIYWKLIFNFQYCEFQCQIDPASSRNSCFPCLLHLESLRVNLRYQLIADPWGPGAVSQEGTCCCSRHDAVRSEPQSPYKSYTWPAWSVHKPPHTHAPHMHTHMHTHMHMLMHTRTEIQLLLHSQEQHTGLPPHH